MRFRKIILFIFILLANCSFCQAEENFEIVKIKETQFWVDEKPFYFIGANQFQAIMQEMGDWHTGNIKPSATKQLFREASENGIKVIRIIMYNLDDAYLENPTQPPQVSLKEGGNLPINEYIYCYTAGNASKNKFKTDLAQTLLSPSVTVKTVAGKQKIKLVLPLVKYAYRYLIYRRIASAPNTERLLTQVSVAAGEDAEFIDDGNLELKKETPPLFNTTKDNPKTQWPTRFSKPFQTGVGNWNENKFQALDRVIELAKKNGIRLILVLADQHENNTGGVPDYCRAAGDVKRHEFFANSWIKKHFKEWIYKIVTRINSVSGIAYKNEPAIFAWELINEPYATGSGGVLRAWTKEMASYIKSLDSNHLVCLGDDGSVWFDDNPYSSHYSAYNVNNNHDFVTMGNSYQIDFLTWHAYPQSKDFLFNWGSYDEKHPGRAKGPLTFEQLKKEFQRRADYAVVLNKPIVMGEWGLKWKEKDIASWVSNTLEFMINTYPSQVLGENLIKDDVLDLEFEAKKAEVIYEKVVDVQPNSDYWASVVFKNNSEKEAYLLIRGRQNNKQKWQQLTRIAMPKRDYWDVANFISNGFLKLNSKDNTQFKVTIEAQTKGIIYIKNIELRKFVEANSQEEKPVFGGICFWNWGTDFDSSNKNIMNVFKSFLDKHKDLF